MSTCSGLTGSPDGEDAQALSFDCAFELLASERRRLLLYALCADQRLPLSDAALMIAGWEEDRPVDTLSAATVDVVHLSLEHSHVPKLERYDVIEVDETDGVITRGPRATQLLSIMDGAGALRAIESRVNGT